MSFCAAINCLDGRTQLPVINFLMKRFDAQYVDMITDAGPLGILHDGPDSPRAAAIFDQVGISMAAHDTRQLAIAGHFDCKGNPVPRETQLEQLTKVVAEFRERFSELEIIGLFVGDGGVIEELDI
jgi:hypothetical protein